MEGKYANIIIDISHEKVDKPFQYKIPSHLAGKLEIGMSVVIPFGSTNKERNGYIIEITDYLLFAFNGTNYSYYQNIFIICFL